MTHFLLIKDYIGTELYNLEDTVLGMDIQSRQIVPIGNGRWEERIRMFAGDVNTGTSISAKVLTLDTVVNKINVYGGNTAMTTPIFLHEKSEGESVAKRRAPLFSASFQPTTEGSVTQFQLNNGMVGLLTIERGDWEGLTPTVTSVFSGGGSGVGGGVAKYSVTPITNVGSISGRISEVAYEATDIYLTYFAMGIRPNNFGTANFQNCISFGSGVTLGTSGTGWALSSNVGATDPNGQTNTYNRCLFQPATATHTHIVQLNEVSKSTLDTVNQDYIGEYRAILRTTQSYMTDAYFKVTFGYGYESNMILNNPVYMQGSEFVSNHDLGSISIPTYPYQPLEAGTDDLSTFQVSLKVELVGSPAGASNFYADSIFLIPVDNYILTNITGDPSGFGSYIPLTMWLSNHVDNSYYFRASGGRASANTNFSMAIPNDGGIVVYLNEQSETSALPGGSNIDINISHYPKYNSLGG